MDEDLTVCATLQKIANEYDLAFANVRNQNNDTIPEHPIFEKMGITMIKGLLDNV